MTKMDKNSLSDRKRRYRRISLWSLVLIVTLAMVLPLSGYLYVGLQDVQAQNAARKANPRANFWRAVREGNSGYTSVRGQETGVLIQNGQNWRQIRNGLVANYGGWFLFITFLAILFYFANKGTLPIHEGRSRVLIKRWSAAERILHWLTAIMFVILAITGLSTLFGRTILIPLLGPTGFSAWAGISKGLHNYIGPAFSVTVAIMILIWFRNNIPNATDIKWFTSGGGLFGNNKHPDGGFVNGGEKFWFWIISTLGVLSIATGYLMNFPNWGLDRGTMQISNVIHSVTGMLWIGVWMGHAYIGSIGSEGSLEAMTTGYVDENWAAQHHNLWVEELNNPPPQATDMADDDTVVKEQPA